MLQTLAVQNYRTLRDFVIPLGPLNLITGANGSGSRTSTRRCACWRKRRKAA